MFSAWPRGNISKSYFYFSEKKTRQVCPRRSDASHCTIHDFGDASSSKGQKPFMLQNKLHAFNLFALLYYIYCTTCTVWLKTSCDGKSNRKRSLYSWQPLANGNQDSTGEKNGKVLYKPDELMQPFSLSYEGIPCKEHEPDAIDRKTSVRWQTGQRVEQITRLTLTFCFSWLATKMVPGNARQNWRQVTLESHNQFAV